MNAGESELIDRSVGDDRLGDDLSASMGHASPFEPQATKGQITESARRALPRLDVVTDILRGWVWETDAKHTYVYLSDGVHRFTGKPASWHIGKPRHQLDAPTLDPAAHEKYQQQLDAQEMFGPLDYVLHHAGRRIWLRTVGMPQFDPEGIFTGYCGITHDVTAEIEGGSSDWRKEPRRRVARSGSIAPYRSPTPIPCVVLDISKSGARLDVASTASLPTIFKLVIDIEGAEHTCEVVWRKEHSVGVHFLE